jgi:hypothetical protein
MYFQRLAENATKYSSIGEISFLNSGALWFQAGLPDAIFLKPKIPIWVILEGP